MFCRTVLRTVGGDLSGCQVNLTRLLESETVVASSLRFGVLYPVLVARARNHTGPF